jgi:hypothetical protein
LFCISEYGDSDLVKNGYEKKRRLEGGIGFIRGRNVSSKMSDSYLFQEIDQLRINFRDQGKVQLRNDAEYFGWVHSWSGG